MNASSETTVIGTTARLQGELIATGDVIIEGQLDGTVRAEGARVTVGKDARVRANLFAQHVLVLGKVEGTLQGARVELRNSAQAIGNVITERFSMEDGALLRGQVAPTAATIGAPTPTQPAPVAAAAPVSVAAPAPVAQDSPAPSLFSSARPAGTMPAGLAAAARSLGGNNNPAGLSALVDDEDHTA